MLCCGKEKLRKRRSYAGGVGEFIPGELKVRASVTSPFVCVGESAIYVLLLSFTRLVFGYDKLALRYFVSPSRLF